MSPLKASFMNTTQPNDLIKVKRLSEHIDVKVKEKKRQTMQHPNMTFFSKL